MTTIVPLLYSGGGRIAIFPGEENGKMRRWRRGRAALLLALLLLYMRQQFVGIRAVLCHLIYLPRPAPGSA
jgi:hypothetical protein